MYVFVKLSLNEPGDVVRMMDKGIAVQPGLRTLFELHHFQVKFHIVYLRFLADLVRSRSRL